MKREWNRSQLRRYSTVSTGRFSRAQSTTSFFLKERPSISQAGPDVAGVRRGSTRFPAVDSSVSLRSMGANGGSTFWGAPITEEKHDDVFEDVALSDRANSWSNGVGVGRNGGGGHC